MKEAVICITHEPDIAEAVRCARHVAQALGFSTVNAYYVATAASELASNVFIHAGGGVFTVRTLANEAGVELVTHDQGPGIADLEQAMQEGFSTAGGLGCGLSGVKRLMDELEIDSRVGQGTQVRTRKWR